jgi:hypothetical protein
MFLLPPSLHAIISRANCPGYMISVVISRAFFLFFPCNHIINIKKYFSFSGEVKDSVIFLFFFYLTRELTGQTEGLKVGCGMGGWVDGWMGGRRDGGMGGWVGLRNGWMGGRKDGFKGGV